MVFTLQKGIIAQCCVWVCVCVYVRVCKSKREKEEMGDDISWPLIRQLPNLDTAGGTQWLFSEKCYKHSCISVEP